HVERSETSLVSSRHVERSRDIPWRNLKAFPRDSSTSLRFARNDFCETPCKLAPPQIQPSAHFHFDDATHPARHFVHHDRPAAVRYDRCARELAHLHAEHGSAGA